MTGVQAGIRSVIRIVDFAHGYGVGLIVAPTAAARSLGDRRQNHRGQGF
jgi:hypothetical protein